MSARLNDFMRPGGAGDLYANMLKHLLKFSAQQVSKILIAYIVAEITASYADRDPETITEEVRAEARSVLATNKLVEEDGLEAAAELVVTTVVALVQVRQESLRATLSEVPEGNEASSVPAGEAS